MLTRILGIISTLILARLLGPSDFGLVALASGFTQTIDAVTNLSVHEALIKEREPPRAMYDTAFTMGLIRGVLTGGAIAATAVPVADFFHEPRLAAVLFALAASNLIGALENVATADFMRTFAFHKEFQLWTIPRVVQVFGTIVFAFLWPTYWALVFGIVTGRLLRTGLSYSMYPYMPRLTLSAWRQITGFTTWSWAIYMIVILRERVDTVLIGRLFSPAQVGIYALGGEIATLPTAELVDPLCRACFPSFSQLRHDGLSVADTYLRLLAASALIVLPIGVGIAAVADPLVKLAFGPNWVEAIPMIQILGVTATLGVVGSLSGTVFSAHGMLRTTFGITLTATLLRGVLLLVFLPGGTLVTAAIVVACVVSMEQAAYITITMRRFGIRLGGLVRAVMRSVFAAGVMAGCLAWLGLGFVATTSDFVAHLAVDALVGSVIYGVVLAGAWLAGGRPDGPERDLVRVLGRIGGYVRRRVSGGGAAAR